MIEMDEQQQQTTGGTKKRVVKKPTKRAKKKPSVPALEAVQGWKWQDIAIVALLVFVLLPNALDIFGKLGGGGSDKTVANYDATKASVAGWLDEVVATDVQADKPKVVEALLATADACKTDLQAASEVAGRLKTEMVQRLGVDGWLNWSVFARVMLLEFVKLRADKQLDASAASHEMVLRAIAEGVQNAK